MTFLKQAGWLLTVLFLAAGPLQAATADESEQQGGTMAEQWNETMDALGSYTAEQRDKALKTGKKTLDAMDNRLAKLEAWTKEHWDSMSEEAREERTKMLDAMRKQRNEVAEWYGGMKHSSGQAWDSVKQGFIESYDELQQSYGDAVDSFRSDDEEPASQ